MTLLCRADGRVNLLGQRASGWHGSWKQDAGLLRVVVRWRGDLETDFLHQQYLFVNSFLMKLFYFWGAEAAFLWQIEEKTSA